MNAQIRPFLMLPWAALALVLVAAVPAAWAQFGRDDAEASCRREVAERFDVSSFDVDVRLRRDSRDVALVDWRVGSDARGATGFCEVDGRSGRVIRLEESADLGFDRGRGRGDRGRAVNYPRIDVDTAGFGSFYTTGSDVVEIERGYVNTEGEPSVGFSDGDFGVMFYGEIEEFDGERSYRMRITGSDRGSAYGTAYFRLNPDENEVEMINVNGETGRSMVNGSFVRK